MADRGPDVFLWGLLQARPEDRIGEVLCDADSLEEGEVGLLKVAGLPAGHVVVDREDDGGVAGGFRPPDQAGGERVIVGPVELVPPRSITGRFGDLLERRRRGGG